MLNVVKAVVSIYRKEEEKPFERFKARVSFGEDHKGIENFKRHLVNFLGLKELSTKFGLGSFELKLYRLVKINGRTENYSIVTQQQLDLELPHLVNGDGESELNGE